MLLYVEASWTERLITRDTKVQAILGTKNGSRNRAKRLFFQCCQVLHAGKRRFCRLVPAMS
jgi:hypothetical protein